MSAGQRKLQRHLRPTCRLFPSAIPRKKCKLPCVNGFFDLTGGRPDSYTSWNLGQILPRGLEWNDVSVRDSQHRSDSNCRAQLRPRGL